MTIRPPSEAGPYERAVLHLVGQADQSWWPEGKPTLAFGGPPWLAMRLAAETGRALLPCSGGNCMTTLANLTVVGCPTLDGPPAGRLVLHDLLTGRSHDLGTRCHRDLPPHRWVHLTLALAEGINPNAAVDLAGIAAV
jgi:hypothetical protein